MSKRAPFPRLFVSSKLTSRRPKYLIFMTLIAVFSSYAQSNTLADIVEESSGAVVQIQTKRVDYQDRMSPYGLFKQRSSQRRYNPHFSKEDTPGRRAPGGGIGSGFLISADGMIVTNAHVVSGANSITVKFSDSKIMEAILLGIDRSSDLAVLKIEGSGFPHIKFGNSDSIRIGDSVLAIGSPFGLTGTATSGIISAKGRDLKMGRYDNYLQIDAPINSGNSGGPVLNMDGEVIAVSTAIYSPNGGNIGIGFAIPSNDVNRIIDDLKKFKHVKRGYLGINMQALSQNLVEALNLKDRNGVLVTEVQKQTPAQVAGLKAGDVLTSFDGESINTPDELSKIVARSRPGIAYKITVVSSGNFKTLSVKLAEQARWGEQRKQRLSQDNSSSDFGIALSKLTPALRNRLRIRSEKMGVLVSKVKVAGLADKAGLVPGDVIVQVDNVPVQNPDQCMELITKRSGEEYSLLLVQRGEKSMFVGLKKSIV